jgi:hypothetical protein
MRKRVLVLLPTTGALNRVLRIKARPDLSASAVYLSGTTRRLAITAEYDFLVSKDGPLTALAPLVKPGPYWLWLSEQIESGESWQVPVLLAHLVDALGAELVEEPRDADLVLWSTGAVDAELDVVDHDYRLAAKVSYSRADLEEAAAAGAQIIGILPAHSRTDPAPLRNMLTAVGVQDIRVELIGNVAAARNMLEVALHPSVPAERLTNPPPAGGAAATIRRHIPIPPAAIVAITAAAIALAAAAIGPEQITQAAARLARLAKGGGDQVRDVHLPEVEVPSRRGIDDGTRPGEGTKPGPGPKPSDDDAQKPFILPVLTAQPAPMQLAELRDPNGRHCASVLYDHRPPRRDDVPLTGSNRFRDTASHHLCGLEWTLKTAEAAQAGIQGFDVDLADGDGVSVIRTGPPGASTKIRIEFGREFTRPLTYNVRMKFAGEPSPRQAQQFQHTIRPVRQE